MKEFKQIFNFKITNDERKFNDLNVNIMKYKTNNLLIYNIAVGFFVTILILSTISFMYVLMN